MEQAPSCLRHRSNAVSSLPQTLIDQIEARTQHYIDLANQQFALQLPSVSIRFDVSGSAWGYYVRKGRACHIRYNPILMARFPKEGLQCTVPHEVAHYVVDRMFPKRRCKPHGLEWRNVMASFGIPNARATHATPLDGIRVRRQARFPYECDCGPLEVTATRHNRMAQRGTVYFCKRCRQPLRFAGHNPNS